MEKFVQVVAVIGFFVCLAVMYLTPHGIRGIRQYDPSFQMPDMQFHYRAEQIAQAFDRIGSQGRGVYGKYLLLDFVFIFCFGILMITITRSMFQGTACNLLAAICIFRALFDILENSFMLYVLRHYPEMNPSIIAVCSCFTSFKFVMLYLWMIGIMVGFGYFLLQIWFQ